MILDFFYWGLSQGKNFIKELFFQNFPEDRVRASQTTDYKKQDFFSLATETETTLQDYMYETANTPEYNHDSENEIEMYCRIPTGSVV